MHRTGRESLRWVVAGLVALAIGAPVHVPRVLAGSHDSTYNPPDAGIMCSTDSFQEQLSLSSVDPSEETAPDAAPREEVVLVAAAESPGAQVEIELAQQAIADREGHVEEYDPWEPFNDKTFWFNRKFDQYLLKPVSTGYHWVVPDVVQESLKNALTNVGVVRRVVNNVLQLDFPGVGREVARFLINSTLGVAGFFDVAKSGFGIEKSDRDTGQTLGVYGVGQGPYLVLPFLPPLTVRDGIGFVADLALDPLVYFAPIAALGGRTGATVINDRSLNLELYENVEETTLDLYSAVRNAYLQRRAKAIRDARPTIQRPPASAELSSELLPAAD